MIIKDQMMDSVILMAVYGRDSQINKAYAAESRWRQVNNINFLNGETPAYTNDELSEFFCMVRDSSVYQGHVKNNKGWSKPELQIRNIPKTFSGRSFGHKIELNSHYRICKTTIIHELAHSAGQMNHSREWRIIYIDLLRNFISKDLADNLRDHYEKAGLKAKPKRKYTKKSLGHDIGKIGSSALEKHRERMRAMKHIYHNQYSEFWATKYEGNLIFLKEHDKDYSEIYKKIKGGYYSYKEIIQRHDKQDVQNYLDHVLEFTSKAKT